VPVWHAEQVEQTRSALSEHAADSYSFDPQPVEHSRQVPLELYLLESQAVTHWVSPSCPTSSPKSAQLAAQALPSALRYGVVAEHVVHVVPFEQLSQPATQALQPSLVAPVTDEPHTVGSCHCPTPQVAAQSAQDCVSEAPVPLHAVPVAYWPASQL
jgi:hypothetical protein